MAEAWENDGWRDTKERPEEPDWDYETGLPQSALGGMAVGHVALKWRRLPEPVIEQLQAQRMQSAQKSAAEWMTMARFDAYRACVKCGHREAATRHHAATEGLYAGHDVLHRQCTRCGYVWHEKPLDAEA